MQEFYRAMHAVVGELMSANNFFIALYDEERQLINWPYSSTRSTRTSPIRTEWDRVRQRQTREGRRPMCSAPASRSCSRTSGTRELIEQGEIDLVGVRHED